MLATTEDRSKANGIHAEIPSEPSGTSTEPGSSEAQVRLPKNQIADVGSEVTWFPPALRSRLDPELRELIKTVGSMHPSLAARASLLSWNYAAKASAAAKELEGAEQVATVQLAQRKELADTDQSHIEAEATGHLTRCAELESQCGLHREELVQAIAEACLPVKLAEPITAQAIEDALEHAAPDADELAGQHGIIPVPGPQRQSPGRMLSQAFFGVAPVFNGFMVALCLGSLVGLLSVNRLVHGDDLPQLGLTAILGCIIVAGIGSVVHNAVTVLAHYKEDRRPRAEGEECTPRLGAGGPPYAQLILAAVLLAAEVTAEALGLRTMHQQYLVAEQRVTGHAGGLMPFGCYLLAGTLVSAPLILHKGTSAWRDAMIAQREGWLHWLRRSWLLARRGEEAVKRAFGAAHAIEVAEQELAHRRSLLAALEARSAAVWDGVRLDPATQARLDYANSQAVGEAAQLHVLVENLTEMAERAASGPEAEPNRGLFGLRRG